jgi:gamma-glutamyltranspeptidase/glutathione hydrolase
MVASCHPFASLAGVEVLRAGGNVVDAAVATNAVLAVTQPHMCGLGGDFFCLYHEAATGRIHCLGGAGRSGSRASLDELGRRGLGGVPALGPGAVSVPGVTRAWSMLLERFGSRSLESLLAPAAHYAADGFPVSDLLAQSIRERMAVFDDPEWRRIFAPAGVAPRAGQRFRQPDLARTLGELGADPDLFYRGRIARAVAARLEREGFVTLEDLARHEGEWIDPVSTTYRGCTIWQTPPPTQGIAVLVALNILEAFDLGAYPLHGVEHLHLLVETVKLAYADRDRWVADPDHAALPLAVLLSKDYAAGRRALVDPDKAQAYTAGEPGGDTTGFVVADGDGNMISVIQSLYKAFGSGVVPPGTGVVLHNRGAYFSTDPAHPNCFGPGKRPFHTLLACLATREGRPVLGYATMGGDGQAMFHVQLLTNLLDYGLGIQEAIERPRFLIGRIEPTDPADALRVEGRVPAEVSEALARRGHNVLAVDEWFNHMGHAHAVTLEDGTLTGGADPRGDGAAIGF